MVVAVVVADGREREQKVGDPGVVRLPAQGAKISKVIFVLLFSFCAACAAAFSLPFLARGRAAIRQKAKGS